METKVQEKTVRWENLEVAPKEPTVEIDYAKYELNPNIKHADIKSWEEMYNMGPFQSITDMSDEELEEARKALAEDSERVLRGAVLFAHGVTAEDFAKALEAVSKGAEKASISLRDIAILSSEFPPMGTCTPCQIALTGNSNGT